MIYYNGIYLCNFPVKRMIRDGMSVYIEYYEREDDKDELPPVIHDCKSCGYSVPMKDKLYVDKFTHPLVYCRHHEVICVADRKPCEWATREVKKSP